MGKNANEGAVAQRSIAVFGEAPRRFSLAEASERTDDELYAVAVSAYHQITDEQPRLAGRPEVALEIDRRTGVGMGIAALAALGFEQVR